MRGAKSWILILLLMTAAVVCTAENLRFAFVQYQIREENYRSESRFYGTMEKIVSGAIEEGAEVVVFPEYTNVFLALLPLADSLGGIASMEEGLALIRSRYGNRTGLKEFFLLRSGEVRRVMDTVWGGLARYHGVWIAAGTAFAAGGDGSLRNRLFLYGPDGRLRYTQDKVYLTPFEKELLRLEPGPLRAAEIVEIEGFDIGFTICRDTFFEEWEKKFGAVDLWVDLKANGVEFDREAEKIFLEALPERMSRTSTRYGATVCLTGSFLELFWEGRSSVLRAVEGPAGFEEILSARSPREEEVLFQEIAGNP